jgi:rSAM/selenodomain-associated transferase 1
MSTAIIIFAKAPVAGFAKTRLIPSLGPLGAAALAHKLLDHAVAQALATGCETVDLCVTPDAAHPAFQRLTAQSQGYLELSLQGSGDLGQRMDRALTVALQQHDRAILMGTDAPHLDTAVLQAAVQALNDHDAVFVPALDGGYALVGLTRAQPDLFSDMPWSTSQVMTESRNRAASASLRWKELIPVADVDEPPDLVHVPPGWLI